MRKTQRRFDFKIYYSENIEKILKIAEKLRFKGVCVVFHKENVAEAQNFKTKSNLQILKGLEIEINTSNDIQTIDKFATFVDIVFAKIKNENLVFDALKSRKIQVLNFDEIPIEQSYIRIAKDTNKFVEICFKTLHNDFKMFKKYKKIIEITKRKHYASGILFTSGATNWNELLGKEETSAICSVLLKIHNSQLKKIIGGEDLLKQCNKNYLEKGVEIVA